MKTETINTVQRQLLANQFRILAKLEDDQSHLTKAEIIENGYSGRYWEVFNGLSEEVPAPICQETEEILNIFRVLRNRIAELSDQEKRDLNLRKISFDGFDANHSEGHHGYFVFMVEELGSWQEVKDGPFNSHSSASIDRYRRIVSLFEKLGGYRSFSKSDLASLIDQV